MAQTVTLQVSAYFASGTTLGAYKRSNWVRAQLPPVGAPLGSADASAAVASTGLVTFPSLADGTEYLVTDATGTKYLSTVTSLAVAGLTVDRIPFRAAASSAVGSIAAGQTVELFANTGSRAKIDLSAKSQVRLQMNVTTVAATTIGFVEYSSDNSNWFPIDGATGASVPLDTALSPVVGSWVSIVAGAKGDVWIRCRLTNNSAGALNPAVGTTIAELR